MNTSILLQRLKQDLGIYALRLPMMDPDKEMINIVQNITIPEFSRMLPDIIELQFTSDTMETTEGGRFKGRVLSSHGEDAFVEVVRMGSNMTIILPNYENTDILYVRDIKYVNNLVAGGYMVPFMHHASSNIYQSAMLAKSNADLMSTILPPITFEFIPPNMLKVYNLSMTSANIIVELATLHAPNLSTITRTSEHSFYKLALLDVKSFWWNAMKHYPEIRSAFGTYSINISDWENAASERNDLLDKWGDVYHLETVQFHII